MIDDVSTNTKRLLEANSIINEFIAALDGIVIHPSFCSIIDSIMNCKGKIITTGMGKAGIAMRKFSSTLCSFGIPSCYLHPGEAQHGDLGIIGSSDILFICSVSGKTREVIEIIDLARKIGVKQVIGMTSHPDSPIRDKVDLVLDMGIIKEAGHLHLAPTSSILIILALTDCLALVAAKEKNITKEQFGTYHHSGYLGQLARGEKEII